MQAPAAPGAVVVAVGPDHGGFPLKEEVKALLARLGYRFNDLGTFSTQPVDYPDIALAVARMVKSGEAGAGHPGGRRGHGVGDGGEQGPRRARRRVRRRGGRPQRPGAQRRERPRAGREVREPDAIVETFLTARWTEERHARRVEKIKAIEEYLPPNDRPRPRRAAGARHPRADPPGGGAVRVPRRGRRMPPDRLGRLVAHGAERFGMRPAATCIRATSPAPSTTRC